MSTALPKGAYKADRSFSVFTAAVVYVDYQYGKVWVVPRDRRIDMPFVMTRGHNGVVGLHRDLVRDHTYFGSLHEMQVFFDNGVELEIEQTEPGVDGSGYEWVVIYDEEEVAGGGTPDDRSVGDIVHMAYMCMMDAANHSITPDKEGDNDDS